MTHDTTHSQVFHADGRTLVALDWSFSAVHATFDGSAVARWADMGVFLDSLDSPHKIVAESSFESWDPARRLAMIDRLRAAGHELYVFRPKYTARLRAQLPDMEKTDENDARLIYMIATNGKHHLTSASDDLHKGHVKWLESELIRLAKEASRAALANSTTPPLPKLPEHDSVFVSTFLSNMLVLYPLLGIDSFTPPTVRGGAGSDPDPIKLHASLGGEIIASGLYAEDGFVLLAGSRIKKESTESLHGPAKRQRQVLKDNEQLADFSDEYWELLSNVELPTSSTAAQLVYGRSASGPESWRTTDGVRLRDLI